MADRKTQDSMDDGDDVFRSDEMTIGSEDRSESSGRIDLADRLSDLLQWLQALDLQVMGACRADERLKPFLKANVSTGVAEDRLLSQLSQHFEASEVGLLARCLCVPLVTMRVGKIVKQGTLFCPTSIRLAILRDISMCSAVEVEEIPADQSGRSFFLKVPDGETYYFWCSEKSRLLGSDLLSKMKDLLKTKPTLAELTGISESRLECFATHLCAYLVGPNAKKTQASCSSASSMDLEPDNWALGLNIQTSSTSGRSLRPRSNGGQSLKGHAQNQGILSPRSSSFKEGGSRSFSSSRSVSKEKLRRRGDLCLPLTSSFVANAATNLSENGTESEPSGSSSSSPLSFLESLENCPCPPPPTASSQFPPISSLFSPYYCWCPPSPSPTTSVPQLPSVTSTEPSLSLPPLPSFLTASGPPTLCTQIPPLDLASAIPPLEFPTLVSADPLSRLPFSKQQISQQIPTFIPLMCDPIVHIPVIDVCSSGQGYLVSAGSALATSIPPLHPKLVGPMMPESESMVEKSARETLRLLIGNSGSQPSASLMDVLPGVLSEDKKGGVIVAGSRGLYSGTSDVDAVVSNFATAGLASMKINSNGSISNGLKQASGELDLVDPSSFLFKEEEKDW